MLHAHNPQNKEIYGLDGENTAVTCPDSQCNIKTIASICDGQDVVCYKV